MFKRKQVCLNGYWDFCPADGTLQQIPDKWEDTKILVPSPWNINAFVAPGQRNYGNEEIFLRGGEFDLFPEHPKEWEDAKSGWYRTEFFIPEDWKGKNITLKFNAVLYYSEFYVNGQMVHSDQDGFLPVEFLVNNYVNYGEYNTLIVGVKKIEQFQIKMEDGSTKYEVPTGSFWGEKMGGIWQDVFVKVYPDVYISDVFVRTDIQQSLIAVSTELSESDRDYQLEFSLREFNGSQVFPIGSEVIVSNGKSEFEFNYSHLKDQIKLWWPHSPSLYYLDVVLKENGCSIDAKTVRFGFRSFKVEGNKFQLNGVPYNLRNDSWHYMGFPYQTEEYAKLWYKMAKEGHANHIRLHAQVYPEFFLDIADEMGMLITDETAIWGSHCKYHYSMNFIENCKIHTERLIKRDRNHPSIIIWNVENECVMAYMVSADNAVKNEAELNERLYLLAEYAKRFDNTRPLCADGCRDYDGRLEVVNIHYPGKECNVDTKKPVVIGEMGSMYYSTPDSVCSYGGENTFTSFNGRLEAIGRDTFELLKQQRKWAAQTCVFNLVWYGLEPLPFKENIRTYDDYSVPGVKPRKIGPYICTLNAGYDPELPEYIPNPVFKWTQAAYIPERFFFEDNRTRYYNGETGASKISVFNDSVYERCYTIEWIVSKDNSVISTYNKTINIAPSYYETLDIEFVLPDTDNMEICKLDVSMKNEDTLIYEESVAIKVYKPSWLLNRFSGLGKIAVAGLEDDRIKTFLQSSDISIVDEKTTGGDIDILIIAGDSGKLNVHARKIIDLVPAKTEYADWLVHSRVEKAFVNGSGIYDILKCDLDENDLYAWSNGVVADSTFSYGLNANANYLVTTGNGTPLIIEVIDHERRNLISCLNLFEYICAEPAAALLLSNLVRYMAYTSQDKYSECIVISKENSHMLKFLKDINTSVRLIDYRDKKSIKEIKGQDVIIVDGRYPLDYMNELMAENTKKVLLWNLDPENTPLCLKGYFDIVKYPLNQLIIEDSNDPIVKGLHSSDLYGLEKGSETLICENPIVIQDNEKVKGILKNADINWRMWNQQAEYIKTAAIMRSSKTQKVSRYGLATMTNNGINIILCQMCFSKLNLKLKKIAVNFLTNIGVNIDRKLEDDFDKLIHDGLYEDKLMKALVLYSEKDLDVKGLTPGINREAGENSVWNIASLDSLKSNKAGLYIYGLYVYSESDRTDLLLNPDLVSMKLQSVNESQVYLNDDLIANGREISISALCFKSGWNKLIIKEKRETGSNKPIQVSFIRKDNDILDLKFSLEPEAQSEIGNDKWVLAANFNAEESANVLKGKGYFWISNADQHDEMYFQIDLQSVHDVSRVQFTGKVLLNNDMCIAAPRSLSIQGSKDGNEWREIYGAKDEKYLSFDDGKVVIDIGHVETRFIRLMLTNVALRSWIISELKIFENS